MEESGESDYLYPYYKAYLMSYNVTRSFAGINGEPDLQFWLENKLYSILRKIQIRSVVYPGTDNKTRPVELLVDSLALPSGLLIDIPSLGFHQLAVTDGKCKLFYDAQPSRRIDEHQICLAINPALMASEKEISELAEQRKIKVESRIQLDFSDLVKIDFTYLTDNLMVRFTPSFNNLSLSFVQWDLGDGSKARTAEAFEHVYPAGGEYLVSLVVNGEFTVTKTLQLKSVIPDISLPAIDKTSIDAPDSLFNTLDSSYGAIEVSDLAKPEIPELAPIISNPKPLVKEQTLSKADYIAKELLKCKNAPELLKYLDQQKAEHLLAYGKLKRDSALDNVWIVIMENDGMITAILQPQDDAFVDLLTKAIVSDVFATYRGKAAIYISYY